ncbi:hypothetical protein JW879_08890 [candidate division WOR-3 bacterium]|nr:hypothetical protein [candidate division WOR-3 bacterium]
MKEYNYEKTRDFFSLDEEKKLVEKLIRKWEINSKGIQILENNIPKRTSFPVFFSMGIIGKDWPGFSTAILGTIHGKGWNISYESGIRIEANGNELGIIILVIEIKNKPALKKFQKDKKEIIDNILNISEGSLAKRLLLSIESKRLEVYSKVINIIKKECKEDFVPDLLGPEGETFKFFASRTKAYITERTPKDLAEQIITNYRVREEVIKTNGEIQIHTKNIKTTKENLTCISVGVYEKELPLKVILGTISFVLPDSKIIYNKEFTTPEGVLIARIEISDRDGKPYTLAAHKKIKKVLKRIHEKEKEDTEKGAKAIIGLELYVRAIIPLLVKEFKRSGLPQVYFFLTNSTEFFLEFKIIIVTQKEDAESKSRKIIAGFNKITGLKLLSTHQPRELENSNLLIFDIKADLDEFEALSELYQKTKKILTETLGKFRDFDEGMREIDSKKIEVIIKNSPNIPEKQIRKIYFSLEDFWRIGAPSSDILRIVETIHRLLSKHQKDEILYEDIEVANGTIIIFLSPKEKILSGKLLDFCSKYKITLSRIEMTKTDILIALISSGDKPVESEKIREIISKITH